MQALMIGRVPISRVGQVVVVSCTMEAGSWKVLKTFDHECVFKHSSIIFKTMSKCLFKKVRCIEAGEEAVTYMAMGRFIDIGLWAEGVP